MARSREEQDQGYAEIGFHPERDFEVPEFTWEEHRQLRKLAEHAQSAAPKNPFLEELARVGDYYQGVERLYRRNPQKMRNFAKKLHKQGRIDVPDDSIFDRLDIFFQYEGVKDWIIIDGGEIREGYAFEEDGVTVKKGFKRLYWK